jgi:hypothetical protein
VQVPGRPPSCGALLSGAHQQSFVLSEKWSLERRAGSGLNTEGPGRPQALYFGLGLLQA